jgi:AraC-like DNA-binding protein
MNVSIVYLTFFCVFLALILFFYNRGYNRANLFLSGYFICSSLFLLTQYFSLFSKSILIIAYFTTVFASLFFLIGPFAYFYIRSMFRDNIQLSKKDYWHFVLFFIIFIGTLPFLFSTWEYKSLISNKIINQTYMYSNYNINYFVPKTINMFLKPLVSLFYLALVSKVFIENKIVFKSFAKAKVFKIWLVMFFFLDFLTFVFYFVAQFAHFNKNKFLFDNPFFNIINIIAFIHFAFILSLVLFPQILYGLPISKLAIVNPSDLSAKQSIQNSIEWSKPIEKSKTNSNNTIFSTEYLLEIESIIHNWIAENKYQELNATLDTFSKHTNIPVHHLSYYFNFILKIKYTDWRNKLRIKHAKEQIDAGQNKSITLEALAVESGFASQSTFIKCFKNDYGCTPSEYIKNKIH